MRLSRRHSIALLATLAAVPWPLHAGDDEVFRNGFEICDGGPGTPGCPGFQVQTPEIAVAPGEDTTYCYFFRAPNTDTLGIRRWASTMSAGMHHLIVYATYDSGWNPAERQPPGTLTQGSCGLFDGGLAGWVYAAHETAQELVLPPDDGAGSPVAVELLPNQPLVLQMYILNTSVDPLTTSARVEAEALAPSTEFTRTATYVTTNVSLSIPPNAVGYTAEETCAAPPAVKFWWLSTRTHHFATSATVRDDATTLLVTTDWEHPTQATYDPPGFHAFSASGLTYECVYNNPTGSTIHSGDSESTDEVCMAIGYFFPATRPMLCIDNVGPL